MKKALVKNGESRIFQIEEKGFDVALPLKWVDVADTVTVDTHIYDGATVKAKPAQSADELKLIENERVKVALLELDMASIRAMREYIASKADAPQLLKDREALAVTERAKIK